MAAAAKEAAVQATTDVNLIRSDVVKLQGQVEALQGDNFKKAVEKVIVKKDVHRHAPTKPLLGGHKHTCSSIEWLPSKLEINCFMNGISLPSWEGSVAR